MPNTRPPNEKPAALATEPVGLTVTMGMAMVGPDVMKPGIDDAVLGPPKFIEETVLDDTKAVAVVAGFKTELDTCVARWLRPDVVPFDDSEVPWLANPDDLVP